MKQAINPTALSVNTHVFIDMYRADMRWVKLHFVVHENMHFLAKVTDSHRSIFSWYSKNLVP